MNSSSSLALSHLTKAYSGNMVLNNLSHSFPASGVFGITGPSGCGKTTLLRLIAGLEQPDSGEILRSGSAAILFQEHRLFEPFSAWENLKAAHAKSWKESSMRSLLSKMLPKTDLDQPVSSYSGGMKRRVELCRLICSDADIFLMDEPFNGLDETTKQSVFPILQEYSENKLLLITTHALEEIHQLGGHLYTLETGAQGETGLVLHSSGT